MEYGTYIPASLQTYYKKGKLRLTEIVSCLLKFYPLVLQSVQSDSQVQITDSFAEKDFYLEVWRKQTILRTIQPITHSKEKKFTKMSNFQHS